MSNDIPSGRRFSHLYLSGGEPHSDSKRMRVRLGQFAPLGTGLHEHLHKELGVYVSFKTSEKYGFTGVNPKFFSTAELRDVLDAITLIYHFHTSNRPSTANSWLQDCRRVFAEENLAYTIDDDAGVHYAVDSAFEATRAGALSSLRGARYANSLSMFEVGLRAMDAIPPDGKAAIRATFASAEGLFRVMYPNAPRLAAAEVEKHLVPDLATHYSGDATARHSAAKTVGSFKAWIDAAHFYRHEPGQQEVTQPPLDMTILLIQQGAGFIRWLAQVDRNHTSPSTTI